MPRPSAFTVGQRVYDKRDAARVPGTLIELKRHTNGSPKWLVAWEPVEIRGAMYAPRGWTWEVDLRPVPALASK